jgi:hypothetical protein
MNALSSPDWLETIAPEDFQMPWGPGAFAIALVGAWQEFLAQFRRRVTPDP